MVYGAGRSLRGSRLSTDLPEPEPWSQSLETPAVRHWTLQAIWF